MKKLLPPILFIFFAVCIPILCWSLGSKHNILYPYNIIGILLAILGLGLAALGKRQFRLIGTNINTFSEPDALVTYGLYNISRNPMYLGFVIALFGIGIIFQGAISSFFIALIYFLISDQWYIKYEEQVMQRKFGEKYGEYCKNTRRWI